jgi:hypothetical protein
VTSFARRRIFVGDPFAIVKAVRHDRCILKRTRNGVRIKFSGFSEVGKLVEQNQVHGHKVRGYKRKILMSTLNIRAVGFDMNPKFRHSRFVGSLDQLLSPLLSSSLTTNQKICDGTDRDATYRAGGGRHSNHSGCFHSGDPFDEAALLRQFRLEMAKALADVYFPPRRSAFDNAMHTCRRVFCCLFKGRRLPELAEPKDLVRNATQGA